MEGKAIAATLKNPEQAEDRNVFLPDMKPGEFAVIIRDWRYIRCGEDGQNAWRFQKGTYQFISSEKVNGKHSLRSRQGLKRGKFLQPQRGRPWMEMPEYQKRYPTFQKLKPSWNPPKRGKK